MSSRVVKQAFQEYKIPFEVEWYFKDTNYLLQSRLEKQAFQVTYKVTYKWKAATQDGLQSRVAKQAFQVIFPKSRSISNLYSCNPA